MADQELQRMQELLAQVNREYEQMGRVLPQTKQDMAAAASGVRNLDMQMDLAGTAIKAVAGAATDYAKAMYNGERGAKAFNRSIDQMATAVQVAGAALALLIPGGVLIKGVVAGLGFLTGEAMKAGKVFGEQADATFDTYQKLAESGALAGDGMNGVFSGLQKMGLGVQEATSYIALFNQNAQTMAQFGTTVGRGRKLFENTVAEMEPFRRQLQALGLDQEAQNDATMTFVKIQNRLNSQTRDNTAITGAAAVAYIKEMDALTKVTGMSRKQQEEAIDKAMRNQRFGSVVDDLISQNKRKEAALLQTFVRAAASLGPDFAQGLEDTAAGFLQTEAAQKLLRTTNGEHMQVLDRIMSGQIRDSNELAEAMQGVFESVREVNVMMRDLGKLGVLEDYFLSYATQVNIGKASVNDFAKSLVKAQDEVNTQVGENGKKQEKLLSEYTSMIVAQQRTRLSLQRLVDYGVGPATTAMSKFAEVVADISVGLEKFLNRFGLGPDRELTAAEIKANAELKKHDDEIMALERKRLQAKTNADRKVVDEEIRAARQRATAATAVARQAKKQAEADYEAGRSRRPPVISANDQSLAETTRLDRQNPATPETSDPAGPPGGLVRKTQQGLADAGLKLRPSGGDIQKDNAEVSPKLIALAHKIQSSIPNFAYFSGFNDKYHHTLDYNSKHKQGLALDFALSQHPSVEQGRKIAAELKKLGASSVRDEYNNPSRSSTGPHFHVEVALAKGGVVQQPTVALVGEKGPEAVVPLNRMFTEFDRMLNVSQSSIKDSTDEIRLTLDRALSELQPTDTPTATGVDMQDVVTQAMSRMTRENNAAITGGFEALIAEVRNLVGVNKNVVDIQEKILRMQS